MADTSENNNNTDMFATPGHVLSVQREKLKLSIDDIAKRIHLDVKIIEAIENDSQEGLPSAIYVRGYLRSYAKTIGIDENDIIELYNADSPPPPPEILPEVKPPTQVSSNDKPVKAFTYLITLGLVLLLLIWYQSNFVVNTNEEQRNTETHINGVDITYTVINHPDSWQSPKVEVEDSLDIEPTTSLLSITDDVAGLQEYNEQQITEITESKIISDDVSISNSGIGPDIIEMKLSNDSWIEINDAKNNRLFHSLALAGKQYSVRGTAPLNILLGFSNGVSIKFNDKAIDVEPYSKNGVARFTLPE